MNIEQMTLNEEVGKIFTCEDDVYAATKPTDPGHFMPVFAVEMNAANPIVNYT